VEVVTQAKGAVLFLLVRDFTFLRPALLVDMGGMHKIGWERMQFDSQYAVMNQIWSFPVVKVTPEQTLDNLV